MKRFDLMALYYPQTCIKSDKGQYIEIIPVKNFRDYRLCRTMGNVNLTDYWFAMVDAEKNQKPGYSTQFISMISDEEGKNWFDGHGGQKICCAFFKFRNEELKITVSDIKAKISGVLGSHEHNWFYTFDNADAILVFFSDTTKQMYEIIEKVKNVTWKIEDSEESVYFTNYYLMGKCNISVEEDDKALKLEIDHFDIQNGNSTSKHYSSEAAWCNHTMELLKQQIQKYENIKNKKMVAYYMALLQIVNVISQYEQKTPMKHMFYIFYPSVVLFIRQLQQSLGMLEKLERESAYIEGISGEQVKKKYEKMQIVESGISEFLDTVEMLMRHMGQSCSDMLGDSGRQGLPYDIPLRLCFMYIAYLNVLTKYLNDTPYEYRYCLAPVVYSRPTTNYIDLGLQLGSRLIRVQISRHCMFMPRSSMIILAHEAFHYIISDAQRENRVKYYTRVMAIVLTYGLVPNNLIDICFFETKNEKEAMNVYLDIVRKHIIKYTEDLLNAEFSSKKEPSDYLLNNIFRTVKQSFLSIIYDRDSELQRILTQIDEGVVVKLKGLNISERVIRNFFLVQQEMKKQRERIWQEDQFHQNLANITTLFRESYPDLATVKLLNLSPIDYLEAILISESYSPDSDIINEVLVSRVGLIKIVMEEDNVSTGWGKKWSDITEKDLNNNPFLIHLKEQVEKMCDAYRGKKVENGQKDWLAEKRDFTIMYCLQILQEEKGYLDDCRNFLTDKINQKSAKHSKREHVLDRRSILLNLFNQFAVYECF